MRVVGVDQSYTAFGHCVDGKSLKKGWALSKYASDTQRLAAIDGWFTAWLDGLGNVDLVAMEGYAFGAKVGREQAGELGGTVKLAVHYTLGPDKLLIVPPTALKKFVTGRGNAKKNEMLLGVYKQWGEEFTDDNQADAYSLEQFGHCYMWLGGHVEPRGLERSWTKYQIEAVEKVRKAT